MNYRSVLDALLEQFERAGLEAPRRQAEWILQEVCGAGRAHAMAYPETAVDDQAWERCLALARRRVSGEPLQYVLGYTDFFGLRIRVTPDVLIPRPETEQLVEHVLAHVAVVERPRLLDIGTGSGCIALAVQSRIPSARLWAFDLTAGALRVAFANRQALRLPVVLFQADALQPGFARSFTGMLDAVVSNPPYITRDEEADLPSEVRDFEPHRALFAPGDPLHFYRSISAEAAAVLRPGGFIFFEVHEERAGDVESILEGEGFVDIRSARDFADRARYAWGQRAGGVSAFKQSAE